MKKHILVTWGSGFIGSHTAVQLLEQDYDLTIIDNFNNSEAWVLDAIDELSWKKINFVEMDIRDEDWINMLFQDNNFDAVIHFAGLKAVWESCEKPFKYYENNIIWSINLLQAMQRYDVKKLIFSSSATVYDTQSQPSPYSENALCGYTTNPYGTTKFVIEQLLRDLCTHTWFDVISLRYFNPIWAHPSWLMWENPQDTPNNLFPYLMKVATGEYEELKIYGDDYDTPDGTWVRDYIHVVDLADAHTAAVDLVLQNHIWFEAINIGTGKGTSVKQMLDFVSKITKAHITHSIVARRPGDAATVVATADKAKKLLWREAKYTIPDAVEHAWKYYRS